MIIPTCGHPQETFDTVTTIAIKSYDIDPLMGEVKCINYRSVCPKCLVIYEEEGVILQNEFEEAQWINHKATK